MPSVPKCLTKSIMSTHLLPDEPFPACAGAPQSAHGCQRARADQTAHVLHGTAHTLNSCSIRASLCCCSTVRASLRFSTAIAVRNTSAVILPAKAARGETSVIPGSLFSPNVLQSVESRVGLGGSWGFDLSHGPQATWGGQAARAGGVLH